MTEGAGCAFDILLLCFDAGVQSKRGSDLMPIKTEHFEKVEVASLDELRAWLAAHHTQADSVWLVRYLKGVPAKFVDRLDLLDELLCFGWIDGLARKLDEQRTMQLISPRQQQAWAQSYKDRVARLIAEGRMQAPGLAAVDRSKVLGLWDAYAEIDALEVPDDLRDALALNEMGNTSFLNSAPSYRRNVLRWISAARRPETRAKRVAQTVSTSAAQKKIPQM